MFLTTPKTVRGEKGELVCTKAFPAVPLGFWGDSDGRRFHDAYFGKYPNIWTHGDWIELTDTGGIIIYGRSDATLNPAVSALGLPKFIVKLKNSMRLRSPLW